MQAYSSSMAPSLCLSLPFSPSLPPSGSQPHFALSYISTASPLPVIPSTIYGSLSLLSCPHVFKSTLPSLFIWPALLPPFPSSFSSPASCNIPPLHPNRFTSAQSKIGDVSEKWLNSASQQLHCEELYMECYYRCGENPFKCLCSVIYSLNFTGLTGIQYIQRSPSD